MRSDLELLLKLQVIDYDLGELERSKDYLPDMMENLNREIEEARTKREEATQQLEEARATHGSLELELKSLEAELQKYQQQMMSIKTNKEYDALVAEIDSIKGKVSDRESRLLEAMEQIETLDKDIASLKEKETQVIENNKKQLEVLQDKMDSIGDKVSAKQGSRQGIMAEITKPTLAAYERVRRGRGGRAVVVVKKRACSACFKALTPKKAQDIRRGNGVYTCDHCGSLLYWDDEISP